MRRTVAARHGQGGSPPAVRATLLLSGELRAHASGDSSADAAARSNVPSPVFAREPTVQGVAATSAANSVPTPAVTASTGATAVTPRKTLRDRAEAASGQPPRANCTLHRGSGPQLQGHVVRPSPGRLVAHRDTTCAAARPTSTIGAAANRGRRPTFRAVSTLVTPAVDRGDRSMKPATLGKAIRATSTMATSTRAGASTASGSTCAPPPAAGVNGFRRAAAATPTPRRRWRPARRRQATGRCGCGRIADRCPAAPISPACREPGEPEDARADEHDDEGNGPERRSGCSRC